MKLDSTDSQRKCQLKLVMGTHCQEAASNEFGRRWEQFVSFRSTPKGSAVLSVKCTICSPLASNLSLPDANVITGI